MQVIVTSQLELVPLTAVDAAEMFVLLSDPELYEHLDDGPPASEEALRERYARLESRQSPDGGEQWLNWVVRNGDRRPLGFVQATLFEPASAWVAYLIGREHWGRGHATAATRAMIVHLSSAHSVTRFLATVEAANERSIRVLLRLGFRTGTEDEVASHPLTRTERLFIL